MPFFKISKLWHTPFFNQASCVYFTVTVILVNKSFAIEKFIT